LIIQWIREFASNLRREKNQKHNLYSKNTFYSKYNTSYFGSAEVIEMDEIYAKVLKGIAATPVWVAYSRNRGKVVAFCIGQDNRNQSLDNRNPLRLYYATKKEVGEIATIYTDGNGSYVDVFDRIGISSIHKVGIGKSQTHLIESINSSIRDNLARFNRKSKRYSKTIEMLENTLLLFFHYKQYAVSEIDDFSIT
jgi:IS1 family transposase